MKNDATACVILAAGKGTRMKSTLPKVMHCIAGMPMLGHVLAAASKALTPERTVLVLADGMNEVLHYARSQLPDILDAIQHRQQGTGDAVKSSLSELEGFNGIVFVLYGDTPLISADTLKNMHRQLCESGAAIAVLGMRLEDPTAYGRLILDNKGLLDRIVECKDASTSEKAINLCNSGVMAIQSDHLPRWLGQLKNANAKGEYYLTDIVALARTDKLDCIVVEAPAAELQGVNDRAQLAAMESALQHTLRQRAMQGGVTLQDPASTYFSYDTVLEADVIVEPHVYFGPGVTVESGVTIRAFSHLEQAKVGPDAIIGPYARLRPGAEIGRKARVGNFVEIKQATLEEGAKVNHLSYIGDAYIGAHANIGAGTVTCNYDGFQKHYTRVGEYAFVGSNTALVAPVEIGMSAIVGAGSVITEDVEADSLSMTRSSQLHRQGWAKQFRLRKKN